MLSPHGLVCVHRRLRSAGTCPSALGRRRTLAAGRSIKPDGLVMEASPDADPKTCSHGEKRLRLAPGHALLTGKVPIAVTAHLGMARREHDDLPRNAR